MLFRSDRKSTRLNSSHTLISYAVFCLKKKKSTELALPSHSVASRRQRGAPRELQPMHSAVSRALRANPVSPAQSSHPLIFFFLMIRRPPKFTLFPPTPLSQ